MSQRNPVLHFPQWPVPPPAQGSPAERAAQCSIKLPQGTGGAAIVYHYEGQLVGDYVKCQTEEEIIEMIKTGK